MYYGEKFNAWTHLVGAILAVAGTAVLLILAAQSGDAWKIVSVSIYSATLVLLYSFSALYHSFRGRAKDILRKLDHQSIYLLIAGSYTPFCLVTLRGPWGWSLLAVVWGLALVGGVQELRPRSEARILSTGDLHRDGLGGGGGAGAAVAGAGDGRLRLGGSRWRVLHQRDHLLCARHPPQACAWCLASVRDGRQHGPLLCDPVLRALTVVP
jgi:hypothetical protein